MLERIEADLKKAKSEVKRLYAEGSWDDWSDAVVERDFLKKLTARVKRYLR